MSSKIPQPLHDRLIVSRKKPETVSAGGIIIPETIIQDDQNEGVVVAVGPKCEAVKVDDRIKFGEYAGTEIEHDEQEYLVMRESDVMFIY